VINHRGIQRIKEYHRESQYYNALIHKFTNYITHSNPKTHTHEYTNIQIYQYTDSHTHQFNNYSLPHGHRHILLSNVCAVNISRIHQFTNIPIYQLLAPARPQTQPARECLRSKHFTNSPIYQFTNITIQKFTPDTLRYRD
jgi:hypothetical protein